MGLMTQHTEEDSSPGYAVALVSCSPECPERTGSTGESMFPGKLLQKSSCGLRAGSFVVSSPFIFFTPLNAQESQVGEGWLSPRRSGWKTPATHSFAPDL